MKKYIAVMSALVMGLTSSSCGILYALYHTNTRVNSPAEVPAETGSVATPFVLDLTDQEDTRVTDVTIEGPFVRNRCLTNYSGHVLYNTVVGRFGSPVKVSDSIALSDTRLIFHYDSESLEQEKIPTSNLIVLHGDEETQDFDIVPSALDGSACTVTAEITAPGVYMLVDSYAWGSAWGEYDAGEAHDRVWHYDPFQFEITIPQEIHLTEVSDSLKDDEDGACQTLLECEYNDDIQIGIEYLERPFYDSAKDFVNDLASQLDASGFLKDTGKVEEPSGKTCYYWYADFSDPEVDLSSLSLNCIVPLSDTQYINIWYGFTDEKYFDKVMASLHSMRFTGEPEIPAPQDSYSVESQSAPLTGKDISITLPEGVEKVIPKSEWTVGSEGQKELPLIRFTGMSDKVLSLGVDLIENRRNARQNALNDMNALKMQGAATLNTGQISVSDTQAGYLYSMENEDRIEMYGYYDLPDSHECLRVSAVLQSTAGEKEQDAYWKMLESVRMAQPFDPENLVLQLPEHLYIEHAAYDRWSLERDNQGGRFYRRCLYDADWRKVSMEQNGDTNCSAAFFYIIDSGKSAQESMQQQLDQYLNSDYYKDLRITDQAEVTLSGGQKGYVFALREQTTPSAGEYKNCYMYGFYDVSDADGNPTGQYIEIDFWLNEPVTDKAYKEYWNCLKTADIIW